MLNKPNKNTKHFLNNFHHSKNVHFHRFQSYVPPKTPEKRLDLIQKLT